MRNVADLLVFARVADKLSFAAAARQAEVSPSAIGKAVARLEAEFGARLFQRSTRRVSLTAEGEWLLERVNRIVGELDDIDATMESAAATPRGRLRLSLPTIGYRLLGGLRDFLAAYPEITLDIDYEDRMVDIVAEGFDAAIRSGDLPDSQLMSRKLGEFVLRLYAAPAYLERAGRPEDAEALCCHERLGLRFAVTRALQEWRVPSDILPKLRPPLIVCNNIEALRQAAIAGLGIAWMPQFLAADAIADGRLSPVLPESIFQRGVFSLLWPTSRQLSPKLRVFADFIARRLPAIAEK